MQEDLRYWGYHKGKQCAADGYRPESTIRELLSGRTELSGHRILCLDMPPRAWEINFRVFSLPGDLVSALIGRYCLPVRPDGLPYRADQVAKSLHVPVRIYRWWLTEARRRYRAMLFGASLSDIAMSNVGT